MTVQDITTLLKEKNDLQAEVKNLTAQLDAAKQMYNESSNAVFQLRTCVNALQNHIQELVAEVKNLKDENAELKACQPEYPEVAAS